MLFKTGTLDDSAHLISGVQCTYLVSTDLQQINWGGSCSFQAFRKWDGLLHAVRSQLLKRATHVICRFAKIIASQYLPHDSMKRCPIRPTAQNIEEVCNFAASCDGGILPPYQHNQWLLIILVTRSVITHHFDHFDCSHTHFHHEESHPFKKWKFVRTNAHHPTKYQIWDNDDGNLRCRMKYKFLLEEGKLNLDET